MSECVRCGYNQQPAILVLHHEDRNRENNQLSNLEVLCPNCHALEHLTERKTRWAGHTSNAPAKIKARAKTKEKNDVCG
jgi:5-methylcytosine-specific restriction endonuclease McrA